MTILAIDPGPENSAFLILSTAGLPRDFDKLENAALLRHLRAGELHADLMAVEMIASYGRPVGEEVFETCVFIGQILEAWGSRPALRIKRKEVCAELCGNARGVNDAVIRQRLIDIYGGKTRAIGLKKSPGPLYGIAADVWQSLALALTAQAQIGRAA